MCINWAYKNVHKVREIRKIIREFERFVTGTNPSSTFSSWKRNDFNGIVRRGRRILAWLV